MRKVGAAVGVVKGSAAGGTVCFDLQRNDRQKVWFGGVGQRRVFVFRFSEFSLKKVVFAFDRCGVTSWWDVAVAVVV